MFDGCRHATSSIFAVCLITAFMGVTFFSVGYIAAVTLNNSFGNQTMCKITGQLVVPKICKIGICYFVYTISEIPSVRLRGVYSLVRIAKGLTSQYKMQKWVLEMYPLKSTYPCYYRKRSETIEIITKLLDPWNGTSIAGLVLLGITASFLITMGVYAIIIKNKVSIK